MQEIETELECRRICPHLKEGKNGEYVHPCAAKYLEGKNKCRRTIDALAKKVGEDNGYETRTLVIGSQVHILREISHPMRLKDLPDLEVGAVRNGYANIDVE